MWYFSSISFGILILFGSCSDLPTANNRQRDELAIRMERKGCYGECPIYVLNIQSDGKVVFEGKGYTDVIGTAESRITQLQLDELLKELRNADVFGLRDSYETGADGCPTEATDMPTVILDVRLNGQEKNISHYHGCLEISEPGPVEPGTVRQAERLRSYPMKLTRFEERIDEIVGTKQWIGERK